MARQPAYTQKNLREAYLQKLTRREIQGARRINPRGRSHPKVHYVPVQTESITDKGRTYHPIDRNVSILARIAALPGESRVRFIYGITDAKGKIIDSYSTSAILIKEYSWDEMRGFFGDGDAGKDMKKSPLTARAAQKGGEEEETEEEAKEEKPEPEDYPMLYIVWEDVTR